MTIQKSDPPLRVVIVDDSIFFRFQLATRLTRAGWQVDATLPSGEEAIVRIPGLEPDLVLMDVNMPGMGGMEAVRTLRRRWKGPIVMMSAFNEAGARATWEALDAGANDFIPKLDAARPLDEMVQQVLERGGGMASRNRAAGEHDTRTRALGEVRTENFRAVVIGASTGGPRALSHILAGWQARPKIPVIIVQHMPAGFTRSFADRLSTILDYPVAESPPDGSPLSLRGAPVVVAAGGQHLRLGAGACWSEAGERRHGVIPSVDVTLMDAADMYGKSLAVVVLTGMGDDGAEGALACRQRGAAVVVESRESALVWGMPGAVVNKGAADAEWPLGQISSWLERVVTHDHRV